jgi:hypothetical protein
MTPTVMTATLAMLPRLSAILELQVLAALERGGFSEKPIVSERSVQGRAVVRVAEPEDYHSVAVGEDVLRDQRGPLRREDQ